MSVARRIFAVLLLSLWLPAQAHCRLEAAGLFPAEGCCASEKRAHADDACTDDTCLTAESEFQAIDALKISPPTLKPCDGLFCVDDFTPTLRACASARKSVPEFSGAPPEVARVWVFVERAAPAPRAPAPLLS